MSSQSVNNIANAIINKINSLISSHNSNNNAHQDIRNSIPKIFYATCDCSEQNALIELECEDWNTEQGNIIYVRFNNVENHNSTYIMDLNINEELIPVHNTIDFYNNITPLRLFRDAVVKFTCYFIDENTPIFLYEFPTLTTSELYNDIGFITSSSVPSASSATPLSDTQNGSVGTGTAWARSDHTHPKSSLYAESLHGHGIEETDLFNVLDCINNNFDNLGSEIVFHDDCSSDMSSQYSVKGHTKSGTYPITIEYNEGGEEPCYILHARPTGVDSFTWFVIPNLQGLDNIRITATVMMEGSTAYSQIFLGLCDTLEQTDSSNYKFDFVRIRGDDKFDAVKNDVEQFSNNVMFDMYTPLKLVFERIGNNITGKVYNEDGALSSWNSYTTTNEYDNPYYFLGLMSKYGYYYELCDLKAEQLII